MLLKVGRHLRPRPHFKMIVSREEGENNFLRGYRKQFTHLETRSHGGPLVLVDGAFESEDDALLAARIAARFSQGRDAAEVEVALTDLAGSERQLRVQPLPADELPQDWYV